MFFKKLIAKFESRAALKGSMQAPIRDRLGRPVGGSKFDVTFVDKATNEKVYLICEKPGPFRDQLGRLDFSKPCMIKVYQPR